MPIVEADLISPEPRNRAKIMNDIADHHLYAAPAVKQVSIGASF
ncbi:hypothetical protein ANO14919_057970 [Xylariales sp. No.14919]|nr:hypothetical protein ANO14919_057970 [Xylariales sp. No.14919]